MSRSKKLSRSSAAPTAAEISAEPVTKAATVLGLMQREKGATLSELVEATAWQPHTARAMLTGLRKKGHPIERRERDHVSCYHLPAAEA